MDSVRAYILAMLSTSLCSLEQREREGERERGREEERERDGEREEEREREKEGKRGGREREREREKIFFVRLVDTSPRPPSTPVLLLLLLLLLESYNTPRWDAADAEIKLRLVKNPDLSKSSFFPD